MLVLSDKESKVEIIKKLKAVTTRAAVEEVVVKEAAMDKSDVVEAHVEEAVIEGWKRVLFKWQLQKKLLDKAVL